MATVTKGGVLPDTGVTKAEVYALVDSATVTAIVNADVAAAAAIAASKIAFAGITTALTYTSNKPKRSIMLTAQGAIVPTTNGATQTQVDSGTEGQPSYFVLDYDKATDEHAYWTFPMPDSYDDGDVTVYVYWTTTDTNADREMQMEISFSQLAESDAIDGAMGTATEIDDTVPSTGFASGDVLISAADTVSAANFCDAGDWVVCKLDRDISGPSGTDIDADVRILAIKIEYAVDAESD